MLLRELCLIVEFTATIMIIIACEYSCVVCTMQAERDVAVGDVLCVERPYATILLPDHYETHCHHCLQAVLAPLP